MVSIYAQVKVPSDIELYERSSANFVGNNVSSAIGATINKAHSSESPFLLGCSDFSMGAKLVDDTIPYYIGTAVADVDGYFPYSYVIVVASSDNRQFSTLTIVFDEYNNQHPDTITIDGNVYNVTSSKQMFSLEELSGHTIVINNWNTPNYPLCIQGITTDLSIDITSSLLIDVRFTGLDRSDVTSPSFGIYSNSGSIEFIDKGNAVKALKESGLLLNSEIEIFLRNRYRDTKIGSFIISDGKYSLQGGSSKLSFKDKLAAWQDVTIPNNKVLSMPATNLEDIELSAMNLENIRQQIAASVKGLDISTYYGDGASSRWSMLWVKTPYVESSSFWAFMTKCCEITGCYISCDEKGRAMIASGGGT